MNSNDVDIEGDIEPQTDFIGHEPTKTDPVVQGVQGWGCKCHWWDGDYDDLYDPDATPGFIWINCTQNCTHDIPHSIENITWGKYIIYHGNNENDSIVEETDDPNRVIFKHYNMFEARIV